MSTDLHSPEHPPFPRDAELLRDPKRQPTEHEKYILDVFMRFKTFPDFDALPAPTPERKAEAVARLDALAAMPPDAIADQDDRVLELCVIISDYPELFGQMGYYLAAEIMSACKTIETSEFRRAFIREYIPALDNTRAYLRGLAALRRRARATNYDPTNVPPGHWGTNERRAAAREQMELVQGLPDHAVMEKYWRMVEIVSKYPDFFTREQNEKLRANVGIEQTWKAHLAKARDDWNFYKNVVASGTVLREIVNSAVKVLKEIAETRLPG